MHSPTPLELQEKEMIFHPKIAYRLPTHVGFWKDDMAIQEEKMRQVAYKRDRCELLIQKTRKMLRNVLKSTILAIDSPYIHYEENYQIGASDIVAPDSRKLYLAGVINERDIESIQHFQHGCRLSATPMKDACVRNTFRIVGAYGPKTNGQQVFFGDEVFLQIAESGGPPLYVQCENQNIATFGQHLSLKLSQDPDIYCRFKFFHWNPQERYKTIGSPVKPEGRVLIQHIASGQNLALEPRHWIPTFYGPEMEVSCHNYRDSHKMEQAQNFWKLITRPVPDAASLVRAAKGELPTSELADW